MYDHNEYMKRYTRERILRDPVFHERVKAAKRKYARKVAGKAKSAYASLKASGICARCGNPDRPLVTGTMCAECKAIATATSLRRRDASKKHYAHKIRTDPAYRLRTIERTKDWQRRHPGRRAMAVQRRLARIHHCAISDFTLDQWEQRKKDFNGNCAYCSDPADSPEIEHVVPLSRDGNHTASNIVPACTRCNRRKRNKTPQEFVDYLRLVEDPLAEVIASGPIFSSLFSTGA